MVHPDRIIANSAARPGDVLLLTKPIGTAILLAAHKAGIAVAADVDAAMASMIQLNRDGAVIMQRFGVRAATDITGFSLLGHARGMARASGVTLRIRAAEVPLLNGAFDLADAGCLPGACFRNQSALDDDIGFAASIDYTQKMVLLDAQTSGGLLMCLAPEQADAACKALRAAGYAQTRCIGEVIDHGATPVEVV